MYNDQLYADGVHGVLLADWELTCETPLAIRNGQHVAYTEATVTSSPPKTRYRNMSLNWQAPIGPDFEVTALHYGYEIHGGQVLSYHFVPPSSVRGALRSWTIRHLVDPKLIETLMPQQSAAEDAPEAAAAHNATVRQGLAQRDTGCELIASLFGLAADESEEDAPSNAGRLHIETEKFAGTGLRPVDVSGVIMAAQTGPDNVRREMPVRNPLDRMTHASREGGLHRFLEVARGEKFKVHLRVTNPLDCDLGLLGLWVREMQDGMLRIGALSSIGRGRVAAHHQTYELWQRPDAPKLQGQTLLRKEEGGSRADDTLAGLWTRYVVPPDALLKFLEYLKPYTGGSRDASSS